MAKYILDCMKAKMKKTLFSSLNVLSFLVLTSGCIPDQENSIFEEGKYPLVQKVDPFVGTAAHGHTYPGATLPFGMVQLSPDTGNEGWDWCSGYHYTDRTIAGFSHTHLSGTGIGDYGDFLFMPTTGPLKFQPGAKERPDQGYRSRFSHNQENAKPGFYGVYLKDYKIDVELTATKRVGLHRYTYPHQKNANVIIDTTHFIGSRAEFPVMESKLEIVNDRQIRGYVRKTGWAPERSLYFVAEFSRPFQQSGLVIDDKVVKSVKKTEGKNLKCYVQFDTSKDRQVVVKVALSAVSWQGASMNMAAECPGWDFQQICNSATESWQKQLSKIAVKGGPVSNQRTFYSALYHSCLAPNLFMDVDGQYRGMDKKIHTAKDFENYTVFSLWDTFRAAHPLLTIIEQDRTNDFINSMLAKYDQSGLLPVWELAGNETWCMIGNHSIPVIADAWSKNIRGFDGDKAFKAMKHSAMQDLRGLVYYKEFGYVPLDKDRRSVSKTVEFAYDDWCVALMAKYLGREDDYIGFTRRSQFYKNVFNRSIGFVSGKNADGSWKANFDPDQLSHAGGAGEYTEGNAWHFTFFAPHDIPGLINLMGGKQKYVDKLDELFTRQGYEHMDVSGLIGQYSHGNEPCHNYAYLYPYAGAHWKTQEKVAKIVRTLYSDKPDGICGNDDCGQMSAWYVLNAMGMYQIAPGDDRFTISRPVVDEARLRVGDGWFTIKVMNNSRQNKYVKEAIMDGAILKDLRFSYADIQAGSVLEIVMTNKSHGY
jgi:predicted alpha-1,2-mannosidase